MSLKTSFLEHPLKGNTHNILNEWELRLLRSRSAAQGLQGPEGPLGDLTWPPGPSREPRCLQRRKVHPLPHQTKPYGTDSGHFHFFPAPQQMRICELAWQWRAAGGTRKVSRDKCLRTHTHTHTHTQPKIASMRCGRITGNFRSGVLA